MRLFSRRAMVVWLVGLLAAMCLWMPHFLLPGPFDRLNNLVFDSYQRAKPRNWANSSVVVVDLNEESLDLVGQWPWPRDVMAELTDNLGKLGAATIVYDVVFSEPDRTSPNRLINRLKKAGAEVALPNDISNLDNDLIFADAISRNPVVTGMVLAAGSKDKLPVPKAGYATSGTIPPKVMLSYFGAITNLEMFDNAAKGIGLFSLDPKQITDGVIREVKLLTGIDESFYPTLSMEALRVAQGAGGYKIKSSDGSGEANVGELRMVSVQVGALTVPTDAFGAMRIYHSYSQNKPAVSAHEVLKIGELQSNEEALRSMIEGRIVLVGSSAAGLLDLRTTPLEAVVPGVFIHAELVDQIIAQQHLERPDYAKGIELVSAIVATVLLLLVMPHVNAIFGGIWSLTLAGVLVLGAWYQFSNNLILLSPLLGLASIFLVYLFSGTTQYLLSQREGAFLREAFGQYLSPTLVEELTRHPEKLILGGEAKTLTILFCDIRGFTALSEKLDPTELTGLLNQFLTPMTSILLNNGATIDKYMGDAIMAFWNAPIDQDNHRDLACKSVLEMRERLEKLNRETGIELNIGVGLNTGSSCVGNLGSEQRFSYSAIGDAVNVASRIEGLTKQYGLDNLASAETVPSAGGYEVIEVDRVSVVGRKEPLTVFHVLGKSGETANTGSEEWIALHREFIGACKEGDMQRARELISTLLTQVPSQLDKLYSVYEERVAVLLEEGVPEEWDGVFVAKQK